MRAIIFKDLSLSFSHKTCFSHFSPHISYGSKIAIIGRNGAGKSGLLLLLKDLLEQKLQANVGYVPQILEQESISGSERLNQALTKALLKEPEILLLDEPTNHLDAANRQSLIRKLGQYSGTLIVATHDRMLLKHMDILWPIENGEIVPFVGTYDDYQNEISLKRIAHEKELHRLSQQKKDAHSSLMKEQVRAAKSKKKGQKSIEERKWPTIVSNAKASRAEMVSGQKKALIERKKQDLLDKIAELRMPEIILPKFSIEASLANQVLLTIKDGSVSYQGQKPILKNIHFAVHAHSRIAIKGANASGKTTLLKAILGNPALFLGGTWLKPSLKDVGYLDQHYQNLDPHKTALENLEEIVPHWSSLELREHLNDFLFRKNEEVNTLVKFFSGGEKARLSLALIAARTPKLLILDEITNNLDLETKNHVIEVLKAFPAAFLIISHEDDFLGQIGVNDCFWIKDGLMTRAQMRES